MYESKKSLISKVSYFFNQMFKIRRVIRELHEQIDGCVALAILVKLNDVFVAQLRVDGAFAAGVLQGFFVEHAFLESLADAQLSEEKAHELFAKIETWRDFKLTSPVSLVRTRLTMVGANF